MITRRGFIGSVLVAPIAIKSTAPDLVPIKAPIKAPTSVVKAAEPLVKAESITTGPTVNEEDVTWIPFIDRNGDTSYIPVFK